MNSDFKELLDALHEAEVRYLVVGGYAVIYHSRPRFTKDLDLWIEPSSENARRLMHAFQLFGLPLIDIEEADFAEERTQYMIGIPPTAIDFLTSLGSLSFEECWNKRVNDEVEGTPIIYMGKMDLIAAKTEAARPEDLVDVRNLSMLD